MKSNGNIRMLTIDYYMHPQVALVSGISTIGTSVSCGISHKRFTVSTCVGACLLLTLDKITSSLANFEVLISLSIDDGTAIDAKEFHKFQTLYLQLMTHVRNIDRKMKVQTEENFQKTIMDKISNLKKALEQK